MVERFSTAVRGPRRHWPSAPGFRGPENRRGSYSRVRRGGAWIEPESFCRSACRLRYESHRRSDHIGFRVVVVARAT